nr:hypothetical protein [Sphingomonas sp. NFR04]
MSTAISFASRSCAIEWGSPPSSPPRCSERKGPELASRTPSEVVTISSSSSIVTNAAAHQRHALAKDRRLQPIDDEAGHFLADHPRHLAQPIVEGDRAGGDFGVGGRGGHHLHQRHPVRRVDRVRDQEAGMVSHLGLLERGGDARAGAAQQRVGGYGSLDDFPNPLLEARPLRTAFLDEERAGDGMGMVVDEADPFRDIERRVAERHQRGQRRGDAGVRLGLDIGVGVADHHVQAVGREQRRPGRADHAAPDDCRRRPRIIALRCVLERLCGHGASPRGKQMGCAHRPPLAADDRRRGHAPA